MRSYHNKDNLPANKEGRHHFKRKRYQAFGAYRPLTHDSSFEIGGAVNKIALDTRNYLSKEKPFASEVFTLGAMAVTFLEHGKVRQIMRQGGLREGLALGRRLEQIETPDLHIPFRDIDWVGSGKRKLALTLDTGDDAYGELIEVAKAVEQVLGESGAGPKLHVKTPDHVTILRYGSHRDGNPLSFEQREHVADNAYDVLESLEITAVSLGKLIVAEGYDRPL